MMDLLFALHGILHGEVFKSGYAGGKLGKPEFGLLAHLSRVGRASPSAAAGKLHMSRPQMSAVIDRLVERGLVEREHDEEDRRVAHISATKAGRQTVEDAVAATQARIEGILAPLGPREIEAVAVSLRQLVAALKKGGKGKEH